MSCYQKQLFLLSYANNASKHCFRSLTESLNSLLRLNKV